MTDIVTSTIYDDAGRAILSYDADNHLTRTYYDQAGRAYRTRFADGATVQMEYDARGRKVTDIDQLGQRTQFGYDDHGRLISVTQPPVDNGSGNIVSPVTQYSYDEWGNLTQIKDALFGTDSTRVTSFAYDNLQRQTSRTLPGGAAETWEFTTTSDPSYPAKGLLKRHIDFLGQKEEPHYDSFGRVDAREWKVGAVVKERVEYRYDTEGRLDQETVKIRGGTTLPGSGESTTYTFDIEDRTVAITSPEGQVAYTYNDEAGWKTQTVTSFNNTVSGDLSYSYDGFGRLSKITVNKRGGVVPSGVEETSYTYKKTGVVDEVYRTMNQAGSNVVGLKTKYTYDDLLRVTAIEQIQDLSSGPDYLLSRYDYTRRADGKITQVSEQESTIGNPLDTYENGRANYKYDALGRLTQEKYRTEPTDPLFSQTTITDYTFDLVGNRKTKVTSGATTETVNYTTYDNRDRLLTETSSISGTTTYGYNLNGEQTTKNGGGENSTYTFDQRGRLVGAAVTKGGNTTNASYIYNEQGIRTRVTENSVQRLLLIDPNNPTGYVQVVEERDVSQGGIIVAAYVYGLEAILQMQRTSEAMAWAAHWLLSEAHSGVRQMLDASAIVREMYRYDAYGVQKLATHGLVNPVQYRGERFDGTLGQYYLRAKFYDPRVGRFTSTDPFSGFITSPLSLHKYTYVHNDAINGTDPSGRHLVGIAVRIAAFTSLTTLAGGFAFRALGGSFWEGLFIGANLGVALSFAAINGKLIPAVASGFLVGAGFAIAEAAYEFASDLPFNYGKITREFISGFTSGVVDSAFGSVFDNPVLVAALGASYTFAQSLVTELANGNRNGFDIFWTSFLKANLNAIIVLTTKFILPNKFSNNPGVREVIIEALEHPMAIIAAIGEGFGIGVFEAIKNIRFPGVGN